MIEKIPFEERLNRLAAGFDASPQYTRKVVDLFCETPVVPALESIEAFSERDALASLLNDGRFLLRAVPVVANDLTFGDLALLITSQSMKGDADRNVIHQLANIYFVCFDYIAICQYRAIKRERQFRREHVDPAVRSVCDLLFASFRDFYDYAKQCSLGEAYAERIEDIRTETGMSVNRAMIKIFSELKEGDQRPDDYCFGIMGPEEPVYVPCGAFFSLFVYPAGFIQNCRHNN